MPVIVSPVNTGSRVTHHVPIDLMRLQGDIGRTDVVTCFPPCTSMPEICPTLRKVPMTC